MNTRLFIHIGTGKTGSSSIQTFLRDYSADLHKQGVNIPGSKNWELGSRSVGNHCSFLRSRVEHECADALGDEVAEQWKRSLSGASGRRDVVVSCEGFSPKHIPFLKKLGNELRADPSIVVYVRSQESYMESSWRQWGCKVAGSIEEWISIVEGRGQCDWERRVDPWSTAFGDCCIFLRPFERSQLVNGDVVADFCSVIRVTNACIFEPGGMARKVNTSLHPDLIEVTRLAKSVLRDQNDNRLFDLYRRYLGSWAERDERGGYSFLSPAQRRDIRDRYSDSNDRLAKRFTRQDSLFIEPVKDDSGWERHPPMSWERFVPILMEMFLNLAAEVGRKKDAK